MGAPNDQTPKTREEVLQEVLQKIASRPDHTVTQGEARVADMDVSALFATYTQEVYPWLDHLSYEDILELDPAPDRRFFEGETWEEVLGRHGMLGKHGKTTWVFRGNFYCYERGQEGPRDVKIGVFLTRDSRWLLWYAEGSERQAQPTNERFREFGTIEELWNELHVLVPDRYYPTYITGSQECRYLPAFLHKGLLKLLDRMITSREERLAKMKLAHEQAAQRMGFVRLEP